MPPSTPMPTRALILCEDFGERLGARLAAEAIAAGLLEGGAPPPDVCPLEGVHATAQAAREALDGASFDPRMRTARALILAVPSLEEETLAGSLAFEAATRARQGGVPAYAVTALNTLNAFDLRILDLQAVIEAGSLSGLTSAGRRLAAII
jgi:hypothetical protein